ncbi:MAG: PorV/PorQ family protein [Elusimicrobia bacterium]|nr:PorV/PorQ family protein [Elusimicrobiota bacterium]
MKRRLSLIWPAAFALACSCACAWGFGTSQKGTSGAQFLEIEPGARPSGMAGAFAGLADDVNSVYYNPAGLGAIKNVQAEGMEDEYFQGANYDFGALAVPLLSWDKKSSAPKNKYGTLGAAVYNLSVGGIQGYSANETPTGNFTSQDFAYALSYGYEIPHLGLSVGATEKYITSNLDGYGASSCAGDAGALYRWGDQFSAGGGVRNLGPKYGFAGQGDPLPMAWYAGGAWRIIPQWLVTAELDLPRDNGASYALGTEYAMMFTENLGASVRAGYASRNTDAGGFSGATFGAGLKYSNFGFDFAFVPFGNLGDTYLYSLTVGF